MPEPDYEKYVNLIRLEVWKKVKYNPNVDIDELLSAGNLAFAEVCKTWEPAKGAFTTHLWQRLRFRLGRTVKEQNKNGKTYLADEKVEISEKGNNFLCAQLSELSKEAKFVINLIFTCGEELVDMSANHVRISRSNIKKYLQSEGWSTRIINKVFDEIKNAL